MGCWNGSCFLTNLPIMHGEDVRVFIVHNQFQNYRNRYCDPTDAGRPLAFSFKGKYDDYGFVDEQNGIMLDFIIDSIKNCLIEMEVGSNEIHDIEVKRDSFDFNLLKEANHEGRLQVADIYGEPTNLKVIMVRQTALDKLLERFTWDTYRGVTQEERDSGKYYRTLNYKQHCDELCKYLQTELENSQKDNIPNGLYFLMKAERILFSETSHIGNVFCAVSAIQDGTLQCSYDDLVREITITEVLNIFLSSTRRTWSPPSGEGSQDNETKAYEIYAQLILDECAEIKKYYGDDDDV